MIKRIGEYRRYVGIIGFRNVKIKDIEMKLSARKDFVFPHPLLPYGAIWEAHAHCTHLQIAHADPQTEICKRVQFLPYRMALLSIFY